MTPQNQPEPQSDPKEPSVLDEILLRHRNDVDAIMRGKSNGKDVGTSAEEAKSEILKHYELKPDETKPSKVTIKGGEWYRETSKPKLEDRPLPAPDDTHGDCFTRQEVEEAIAIGIFIDPSKTRGQLVEELRQEIRKRLGIG